MADKMTDRLLLRLLYTVVVGFVTALTLWGFSYGCKYLIWGTQDIVVTPRSPLWQIVIAILLPLLCIILMAWAMVWAWDHTKEQPND